MSIISEFFHSGIPYILVSLFFVVYSVKVYKVIKTIEKKLQTTNELIALSEKRNDLYKTIMKNQNSFGVKVE